MVGPNNERLRLDMDNGRMTRLVNHWPDSLPPERNVVVFSQYGAMRCEKLNLTLRMSGSKIGFDIESWNYSYGQKLKASVNYFRKERIGKDAPKGLKKGDFHWIIIHADAALDGSKLSHIRPTWAEARDVTGSVMQFLAGKRHDSGVAGSSHGTAPSASTFDEDESVFEGDGAESSASNEVSSSIELVNGRNPENNPDGEKKDKKKKTKNPEKEKEKKLRRKEKMQQEKEKDNEEKERNEKISDNPDLADNDANDGKRWSQLVDEEEQRNAASASVGINDKVAAIEGDYSPPPSENPAIIVRDAKADAAMDRSLEKKPPKKQISGENKKLDDDEREELYGENHKEFSFSAQRISSLRQPTDEEKDLTCYSLIRNGKIFPLSQVDRADPTNLTLSVKNGAYASATMLHITWRGRMVVVKVEGKAQGTLTRRKTDQ